jgi:hypothetical protein
VTEIVRVIIRINNTILCLQVNASLRSVEEERDVIQNKLLIEVESRKELEGNTSL